MPIRCLALLSGGLDSKVAIRLMQHQGVEVEALNFKTMFTCCQDQSVQAAAELGVRLTAVGQDEDYLDLLRQPRFGFGKGANPCVDCRIYMFQKAKSLMEEVGAQFIVSGEVVGQRPMSQKKRDLATISYHSDLEDLLLRPLSAKLLPPTLPEREGWVEREQLYDFCGRGRKGIIQLAKQLGIEDLPMPSSGCALTEIQFARKVHDLTRHDRSAGKWDFELIKTGRHFRYDGHTKVVVGRNESDCRQLRYLFEEAGDSRRALLEPEGFPGPTVLIRGATGDDAIQFGAGLLLRYCQSGEPVEPTVRVSSNDGTRMIVAQRSEQADDAELLTKPPSVRPRRKTMR